MARGVGAAKKTLWPHIEQPPWQAFAVALLPILLLHDETLWTHRDQRADLA